MLISEQADAGEAEIIPHLLAFHERVFASISLCLFLFFLHQIQEDVGLQRAHVQSTLSGLVSKLQDVGGWGGGQPSSSQVFLATQRMSSPTPDEPGQLWCTSRAMAAEPRVSTVEVYCLAPGEELRPERRQAGGLSSGAMST